MSKRPRLITLNELLEKGLASQRKTLAMAEQDPLIRATKKAYHGSKTYQIDRLLEARSRWSRKVTIASNKLADVNAAIVDLCKELASDADKKGGGVNAAVASLCEKINSDADKKGLPHETKTSETPSA